jgi:hypothetical protein
VKPRHAAALALVGWYLMVPPFSKIDQWGHPHADPGAPLAKWHFYNESRDFTHGQAHALEFRTYDECERQRKGLYDGWFGTEGHQGLKNIIQWDSSAIDARTEVVVNEKCVATDDPRLKLN